MARLGVDFGTTNTVAAVHDRGVLSVVQHQADTAVGMVVQDVFPSAILIDRDSDERWFGLEAERRFNQMGTSGRHLFVPSLKRQLHDHADGETIGDGDGPQAYDVADLLTQFLSTLAASIRQTLNESEPLETVISWPAHANGAQRHVTRRAFRDAGFEVLGSVCEPTAAAIELCDCLLAAQRGKTKVQSSAVAVFDLGGGTFDASVVWIDGHDYTVLASEGVGQLGGDDFDRVLLEMFLAELGLDPKDIGQLTRQALLRHARAQKETICTGSLKSLFLNPMDFGLDGTPVSVPVEAYCKRLRPMLKPAVATLKRVIEAGAAQEPALDPRKAPPARGALTIYLVGGSSKLPLVAQMVQRAFPRTKIVHSDKPFRSVAMGAAVCAAQRVTYRDVFARHFGLIRLAEHGQRETFDPIFPAGTPVPRKGEPGLEKVAWYRPMHNLGHLKYLECTTLGPDGMPAGDVRSWSDILFPYDPSCPLSAPRRDLDVVASEAFAGEPVCEVYRCDGDGVITVELKRPSRNDSRCYEIYRQ